MAKGILGRKLGMTQIFNDGILVSVTVIDVADNVILQQKNIETDGYVATQIGFESKRESLSNKPDQGHVKKANTAPKRFIKEIRFPDDVENELLEIEVGKTISTDLFKVGEIVDVTGTTKGKGFAGSIKRHNQHSGPMAHGSRYHRGPGSMGAIKGKLKGKNLPGHMGVETVTIQNLLIVAINEEHQLLLVSGSIPGPKKGLVIVRNAIKSVK